MLTRSKASDPGKIKQLISNNRNESKPLRHTHTRTHTHTTYTHKTKKTKDSIRLSLRLICYSLNIFSESIIFTIIFDTLATV